MYPDYNTRLYLIEELTGSTTQTWTVSLLNISNSGGVNYVYSSSPDKFNYGSRSQASEMLYYGTFDVLGNAYLLGAFTGGLYVFSNAATTYCGAVDANTAQTDVTSQYTNVSPYSLAYTNIVTSLIQNFGSPSPRPQYTSITLSTATVVVTPKRNSNLCFDVSYVPTMASTVQPCSVGVICQVSYPLQLTCNGNMPTSPFP